ncbi:MMPL family transporter [Actinacidiphila bryophytorum]|uniref:Membrane protein ActII-3 n=1 Tax=Actinacidiphila bryophytorum TaxID=1436133 RepID=A0A9W4H022_9ACTN|nr:MMPL family transporter [Actinacidiphila bryophytorum]MBM9434624.1 MMPL family transporter [Actinacidiphila bryophytorum]CAG7628206.1 Putative membrane protein ActII-3 [Actinacidiphila bryophytorum]
MRATGTTPGATAGTTTASTDASASTPAGTGTGTGSARRRLPWAVIGLWIVVLAVSGVFAGKLNGVKHDDGIDYLPASAQSTQVARIQKEMSGGSATDLVLVYDRVGGLTAADRAAADRQTAALEKAYPTVGTKAAPAASKDGRTLIVPVSVAESAGKPEDVVKAVRDRLAADRPAGLTIDVGGPGAAQGDAKEVFASIDGTLLISTAGIVALLLILTYRSPFLWLVPLAVVGVAAGTAMALVYGMVQVFGLTVSDMSSSVMTVLIFGAGTDYALLLIARYRDELRRIPEPYDAMRAALRGVGPAVLTSAATVVAGLLCLLAADLNSSRGLGPVGAVGIVCSLAAMTTLLPAVLVLLGRRVFWPLIPAYGTQSRAGRGVYRRIGTFVVGRPVAVLAASTVAVGALALGIGNLPGALHQDDTFTSAPESVAADHILHRAFPERSTQAITVVVPTERAAAAKAAVSGTPGVASAATGRSGGGWTEISAYPAAAPDTAGEKDTIARLRAATAADHGLVGGTSAQRIDTASTSSRDARLVIPLVLAAVFLLLAALLRSLVAPLLLTVAMVGVWAAALGIGGLIFGPVLGFHGMDPGLPLLSFVFLVALGVDYGIFLMHRMREEARGGAGPRRSTVVALESTGGVIASAGIVLAATFTVLASLPLVMMVEMGLVIALGVLLDTFVVRTFLVPAAATLLGARTWSPASFTPRVPPIPAP